MDLHASRVLWAVLETVREGGGYRDVLARLCRALVETVPCDRATVYTLSRRVGVFMPKADYGTPAEVVQAFIERGFDAGSYPDVGQLAAGRVLAAERGTTDGPMATILRDAQLEAMAVVPLLFAGQAEGVLACGLHRPPAFHPDQIAILQRIAPHIAGLIRIARLESESARLVRRRTWLANWAAEVLAATDVEGLREMLANASRDLFRASGAWLLLIEDGELVGRRLQGGERGEVAIRLAVDGESASAEALRRNRVLVVNDFLRSPWRGTAAARTYRPESVLVIPLADAEGQLGVLMIHDLHDRRRFGPTDEEDARLLGAIATSALRKLLLVGALTRASAAKSEFLASVSHDLRTPLNIIVGYAQLLAEETFGPIAPEQTDALQRILRTGSDQLGLINDLLDLARIEQGMLACAPRPLPVTDLVPPLREMMEVLLRDRPVRFEVDVAPEAVASADPERLRQILVNLLANAAKFTREGCVRLGARLEPAGVQISVEDTGPGIDPRVAERVFEPFIHGESEGAGSGLGLAIVTRLLRLQGGQIRIDSRPGAGTRVDLVLPKV